MSILHLLSAPWAATEAHLNLIYSIYEARLRGVPVDLAELRANSVALPGPSRGYEVREGVAVLPIRGTIAKRMNLIAEVSGGTSSELLVQDINQAAEDEGVNGIILSIDSPGGSAAGTEQAANAVLAAKKKKPVYALTDGMMASAAYWIGSAAEKVYLGSRLDVVGSIGVYRRVQDITEAEKRAGIVTHEIIAGKFKNAGSPHASLTQEARQVLQDEVDAIYSVFVSDVANYRGFSQEQALTLADGRVFTGDQAIRAGLVDGYSTLEELILSMNAKNSPKASQPVRLRALPPLPAYVSHR